MTIPAMTKPTIRDEEWARAAVRALLITAQLRAADVLRWFDDLAGEE